MNDLKKLLLAAVAVSGVGFFSLSAWSEDVKEASAPAMTGVLIDNACGAKQADEAAAAKHPIECAMKEACAQSGYQLVVGDKHFKFDDKGNEQAKAYLEKAKSTKVSVEGKMDGETLKVSSIKAAEKEGDKKDDDDKKDDKKDSK